MTLEATVLKGKQLKQARLLWHEAFDDDEAFINHYFSQRVASGHIYGISDHGEVVSMLCAVPMIFRIRGIHVKAAMITGVCTKQQMRGKGFAAALIRHTLPELEKLGYRIAYLSPAVYGFYEKFGFEYISACSKETYQKISIPMLDRFKEHLGKSTLKKADAIYSERFQNSACTVKRRIKDWRFLIREAESSGGGLISMETRQGTGAYAFWNKSDEKVSVSEAVWNDREAASALFDRIISMTGEQDIKVISPYHTKQDWPEGTENNAMARILSLKGVVRTTGVNQQINTAIKICVKDTIIKSNEGTYQISFKNGRARIGKSQGEAHISFNISDLTQLLCGFSSIYEVADQKMNSIRSEETLKIIDMVFPRKRGTCFEKY
jgi:predicted acetyltransferase